jgi:hypothetical protein
MRKVADGAEVLWIVIMVQLMFTRLRGLARGQELSTPANLFSRNANWRRGREK